MFIKGLFFGIIISLPVSLILLRVFKGRFFMITSPYFAGALYGFWLWIVSLLLLFLDAVYGFAGIASSETGLGLMAILTSAHGGFITGGILAALVTEKFYPASGA